MKSSALAVSDDIAKLHQQEQAPGALTAAHLAYYGRHESGTRMQQQAERLEPHQHQPNYGASNIPQRMGTTHARRS